MEILKEAKPRVKMKLWVIEHFRVLPTDRRYKELLEDQIELLFCNFLSSPTSDDYRESYYREKSAEAVVDSLPEEALKKMGYNEDDIKKIAEEVRKIKG